MDATLVVAMGGGDAQELVLWRRHATRRHGLHHEAHHTSYYFCAFIKKVVGEGKSLTNILTKNTLEYLAFGK